VLRRLVASHRSGAAVLRSLGFLPDWHSYHSLRLRLRRLGLDTSHWISGKPAQPRPFEEAMRPGGYAAETNRTRIKARLIASGVLLNSCSLCNLGPEWNGKPLVLRLDHINGVPDDYTSSNLRLVCPNCDSQLPTFSGRNARRGKQSVATEAGTRSLPARA